MNYTRSLISCIKNSRACFIGAKDSRLRLESLSADKTRSFVLYTLHKMSCNCFDKTKESTLVIDIFKSSFCLDSWVAAPIDHFMVLIEQPQPQQHAIIL